MDQEEINIMKLQYQTNGIIDTIEQLLKIVAEASQSESDREYSDGELCLKQIENEINELRVLFDRVIHPQPKK